ncbi:MAG: DUF3450 family protein [Deltaproteobacteria bacterium]|nr:DUF3450 family protein [Deltaproteobacteria bacterium]MCB9785530.1 DUF3450 family protein [Deltaproteobacteria bacterium]
MKPRRPTSARTARMVALAGLLCGLAPTSRAADATSLAAELARLRAEVETLSGSIQTELDERRMRLRGLQAQRTELDLELQRESMRLTQVKQRIEAQRVAVAQAKAAREAVGPAIGRALTTVRQAVATGLPYRVAEREAELTTLQERLDEGLLTPGAVLARLWERVEDELRLARTSGLDRQVLAVDGTESLADVIHVGMVMLYFRLADGRFGRVVREGLGWRNEVLGGERERAELAVLFDAFDKRIRSGWFELPSALPASAGGAR